MVAFLIISTNLRSTQNHYLTLYLSILLNLLILINKDYLFNNKLKILRNPASQPRNTASHKRMHSYIPGKTSFNNTMFIQLNFSTFIFDENLIIFRIMNLWERFVTKLIINRIFFFFQKRKKINHFLTYYSKNKITCL